MINLDDLTPREREAFLALGHDTDAVVLALVRFALAHVAPGPAYAAATAPRTLDVLEGGRVRVLDRPGHPDGSWLVWRDVREGCRLTDRDDATASTTDIPGIPVEKGRTGAPIRRVISAINLRRFLLDLDPVKDVKKIAAVRAVLNALEAPVPAPTAPPPTPPTEESP